MVAFGALTRPIPATAPVGAAATGAVVALAASGRTWVVAVVVTAGMVGLALWRFEGFVLALLVARPAIDALAPGGAGSSSPAGAIGWLFVCGAVTWLLVQRRPAPTPASPLLGPAWLALGAAAVASALSAPDRSAALDEAGRFVAVALMVPVVNRLAADAAALKRIVAALLLAAAVPVTVALGQAWTGRGAVYVDGILRARGTFLHPNSLAIFCVVSIALGLASGVHLRGWPRAGAAAIAAGSAGALLVSYARGAWLGALVAAGVVLGLRSLKALPALAIAVGVLAVAAPSLGDRVAQAAEDRFVSGEPGNSLVWRVDYWGRIFPLATERPLLGLGPGAVERRMAEGKPPHNDPLRIVAELGLVGSVAYSAVLVGLAQTAARAWRGARRPIEIVVASAAAGATAAFGLLSVVSNLISQVVVMWELTALVAVAGAVPRVSAPEPSRPAPEPTW